MRYSLLPKVVSQDELALLITALAAYQHNHQYKAVYDKLVGQQLPQKASLPRAINRKNGK